MSTVSNRMKVRVSLTVYVNPEDWDLAYGTGTSAKEIRDDVKAYVQEQVLGSAAADEGGILDAALNNTQYAQRSAS